MSSTVFRRICSVPAGRSPSPPPLPQMHVSRGNGVTAGLILIGLDRNILRRGTGALLNARLIPVIYEFLGAVRHVLAEFHLDLPLLIMRSDGHLMSSDYTALHPVETLPVRALPPVRWALSP